MHSLRNACTYRSIRLLGLAAIMAFVLTVGCTPDDEETPIDDSDAGTLEDVGDDEDVDDEIECGSVQPDPCGNYCADLQNDSLDCGSCGNECASTETCEDGECVVVEDCREPEKTCDDGEYCDDETGDCRSDCDVDDDCADSDLGEGICDGGQCTTECDDGARQCGGECVPCPIDDEIEETTCDLGACVPDSCIDGYTVCENQCVSCPDEPGETTCDNGQCVITDCDDGYHQCNGDCVPSDDVDTCGGNCDPCPDSSLGDAICTDALECSLDCDDGTRLCDGDCAQCPDGYDSDETTCDAGQCVPDSCDPAYWPCDTGCCMYPTNERIHEHEQFDRTTAIAVDQGMRPHVAFSSSFLRVYSWDGQEWNDSLVEESATHYADIIIGDDGLPLVTYYHEGDSSLEFAELTLDGDWETTTLDAAGNVGWQSSMFLDDDLHIAYRDVANSELKYALREDGNWSTEVVDDNIEDVGASPSIAVVDGTVHIVYRHMDDNYLLHAYGTSGDWTIQEADDLDTNSGNRSKMVVDSGGELHVVHTGSFDVHYSHFDGDNWSSETVDDRANYFYDPAIIVDDNDNPEIVYTDHGTGDNLSNPYLHHATWSGSEWNISEEVTNARRRLSMAVDDDGQRHLSYTRGSAAINSTTPPGTYYFNF